MGIFLFFKYFIDAASSAATHADSALSEDAEIEPRTVATSTLTVRRSNHSARSHPQSRLGLIPTRLDHIHTGPDLIHTRLDLIPGLITSILG